MNVNIARVRRRRRSTSIVPRYELLESRLPLAVDGFDDHVDDRSWPAEPISSFSWFRSVDAVDRVPLDALDRVDDALPSGVVGPLRESVGEWIVQLSATAVSNIGSAEHVDRLLSRPSASFSMIQGLGAPGLVLVRGRGESRALIEDRLRANEAVQSFSLNQMIRGQAVTPNDTDFNAGLMPGLESIAAKQTWTVSRGSSSTVVGVLDTGIDPAHSDLYLNIWLNQGELPLKYLDDVGPKLVDIDGDGLITFYDLNNATRSSTSPFTLTVGGFLTGPNASLFTATSDRNGNGRIDAIDLLQDPNWADGFDTDGNGFFDDLFGVNFRSGAGDPFASNNPSDELGHGTHVAGTIGAIGNNGVGVVGVNWQTSLVSLRILDNNNQGDTGAAIRAINYAREMRERYRVEPNGRTSQGANVRVLNNSWGQPGGFDALLESTIRNASEAGMLFVAAAGNGNLLGQGVDNDRTPFYPASYDLSGVISVGASDVSATTRPASFSNFGKLSVDLYAPGVGIRSTLPGGRYGNANGTSMATPHVSGTAALVWSAFPEAEVDEVRRAILSTTVGVSMGSQPVATSGKLDAFRSIQADVFAPSARLVQKEKVVTAGGVSTEFKIQYSHSKGINAATIDNDDLVVVRRWGNPDRLPARLKPGSIVESGSTLSAVYIVDAPGGTWDPFDFGDYVISTLAGNVSSKSRETVRSRELGFFEVEVSSANTIYVDDTVDSLNPRSLRGAIAVANARSPLPTTIILRSGVYPLQIAPVVDPSVTFALPNQRETGATFSQSPQLWSNGSSGDFDITGNITIVGDQVEETLLDGGGLDRVFKVHPGAQLSLKRVTLSGGSPAIGQPGGGILSLGNLTLEDTIVRGNRAAGTQYEPAAGGGIAVVGGSASISRSRITENSANSGAGLLFAGNSTGTVTQSTLDNNGAADFQNRPTYGAAIGNYSTGNVVVTNTTIAENSGVAVHAGRNTGPDAVNDIPVESLTSSISGDGRWVAFSSSVSNLVPGDTNNQTDVFLWDRSTNLLTRISVNAAGVQGDGSSFAPDISTDGTTIAFASNATNLVPGDTNEVTDVFVYNRVSKEIQRVSTDKDGKQSMRKSTAPSISGNGRYVAFESTADDLISDTKNDFLVREPGKPAYEIESRDVFRKDVVTGAIRLVSSNTGGFAYTFQDPGDSRQLVDVGFAPSISDDGQRIAFESNIGDFFSSSPIFPSARHIYLWDSQATQLSFVNTRPFLNNVANFAAISGDGSSIVYSVQEFLFGFPSLSIEMYEVDGPSGPTSRVIARDPRGIANGIFAELSNPSINGDGTRVAFRASPPGGNDFYVVNTDTDQLVDPLPQFGQGNASISSDGNFFSLYGAFRIRNGAEVRDASVYDLRNRSRSSVSSLEYGDTRLVHTTLGYNSSIVVATGKTDVGNSLFVGNSGTEAISKEGRSLGNNVFDTASGSFINGSDIRDNDARVQIGGLTRFSPTVLGYAPLLGSKVTNAANSSLQPVLQVDQRNKPRQAPDIGSIEITDGTITGRLFRDTNGNSIIDPGEVGAPGIKVFLDLNNNGEHGAGEPEVMTSTDNPATIINEEGLYQFSQLSPGDYVIIAVTPDGFRVLPEMRTSAVLDGAPPKNVQSPPQINDRGSIAVFEATTSLFVPGGVLGQSDTYKFTPGTSSTPIQVNAIPIRNTDIDYFSSPAMSNDGSVVVYVRAFLEGQFGTQLVYRVGDNDEFLVYDAPLFEPEVFGREPDVSGDGRYIYFESDVGTILPNDANGVSDVYMADLQSPETRVRISNASNGNAANGSSNQAATNGNGLLVAFTSRATNLIANDTNGFRDIFVFDRGSSTMQRVSVSTTGLQANGDSHSPRLSDDGTFVVFVSSASNLVDGDLNGKEDIFLYDRSTGRVERISAGIDGFESNGHSTAPDISGDGRHIVFASDANNLVVGDNNAASDVFVFDRDTRRLERFSLDANGNELVSGARAPSINSNGEWVGYRIDAGHVVAQRNPLEPQAVRVEVSAGGQLQRNIGLIPDPGQISGLAFEDLVENAVYDSGEPVLRNLTVFLDANRDGLLSSGEVSTVTDAEGRYRFPGLSSERDYTISVVLPSGKESVLPGPADRFQWNLFLPAGGTIANRDFGFRVARTTGQSSASAVSGRLFDDRNGNKVFDAGDVPIANREVYLDATNFGTRDPDEPRALTNDQGMYSIPGLSSRTVAITTSLDETLIHSSPLGSTFNLRKRPLFNSLQPFSNPQAIATGDFNQDGFLDVAVALGEGNKLSIRLNDGQGSFLPDEIDVDLGTTGTGPTSIIVGQFDNDSNLDVALAANLSSNVVILLNYNPTTKAFASLSSVAVGLLPIDLATGQFGGDAKLDLVVVNQGSDSVPSTVQLLTNNGNGIFTAGPGIPTGGKSSVSLVSGNFTGDGSLDVAVVHAAPITNKTPFGGVTLLRGNGAGTLTLQTDYFEVGALPIDSATADFNGDGRLDIAVANFSSNSISIVLGKPDGTMRVQPSILGTASGAFDIAVGDIDNDGDSDVIASNLVDRNLSIFRNTGVDGSQNVRFEPLENVGLGQFQFAQRMPLVLANFDKDSSGPNGSGTLDIVTVPQKTDTLHVLNNRLVNGTHRVSLTGTNQVTGLDFIIKPAILAPRFDEIVSPIPIVEDSTEQSLRITGVAKGRVTGPALRFSAASSNTALIANPVVDFVDGSNQATVRYTSAPNANGTSTITIRATDAGADQAFGTNDDGILERSFTVSVISVNDAPTFSLPASRTVSVNEDAGPQSIAGFLTGITPGGGAFESNQTLSSFVVTTDRPEYFTTAPAIDSTGRLTFRSAPNVAGNALVTVTLRDNGGVLNGGADARTDFFILSINAVNDAPSINIGGKQTVVQGSGLQSVSNFATGFLPGGGSDEASQTIAGFVISVEPLGLFNVLPSISNTGVLTYAPSVTQSGTARVSVQVRDNGGSSLGGVDLSPAKFFDIEVTPLVDNGGLDFGDAPTAAQSGFASSYPTLQNNGGARHRRSDLVLGAGLDTETDGQPTASSSGDDSGGTDDEDGILFPMTHAISAGSSISNFVAISSGTGFIDAWIDFNRDGDWSDSGEQIATRVSVEKGRNILPFPVPTTANAGKTFARFRLSTAGGLSSTGEAADGEVEDYEVTLVAGTNKPIELNASLLGPHEVAIVGGQLAVSIGGRTVWSAPSIEVSRLTVSDNVSPNRYVLLTPTTQLKGVVAYKGSEDLVDLKPNVSPLNLGAGLAEKIQGIQRIDLSETSPQVLQFTPADLTQLNPGKKLRVVMDAQDALQTNRTLRSTGGRLENGTWVQTYTDQNVILEVISPRVWRNAVFRFDVDRDATLSPLDVLQLVNAINSNTFPGGALPSSGPTGQQGFLDPNGDNTLSPLDVLAVVNELNRGQGGGEGESDLSIENDLIDRIMRVDLEEVLGCHDIGQG